MRIVGAIVSPPVTSKFTVSEYVKLGFTVPFRSILPKVGVFIFREIPENLKIFETSKSGVRKNQVGQGTAELNEMVQYLGRKYFCTVIHTALDL